MSDVAENTVFMRAPWRRIFDLAADVERWPDLLPHYRWVHTLERRPGAGPEAADDRVIEMAARRGVWPVKWRALLRPRPDERRVWFTHLGGPARGMEVYWEFQEAPDGVHVTIHHDLTLQTPLIRTRLGKWIVARGFIRPVADRTLACMKRIAEAEVVEGKPQV